MKDFLLKRKGSLIVLALILLVIAWIVHNTSQFTTADVSSYRDKIELRLHDMVRSFELHANEQNLNAMLDGEHSFSQSPEAPYHVYVYHRDSLIFWNDHSTIPIQKASEISTVPTIYKFNNGIYLLIKKQIIMDDGEGYAVVGALPIKHAFSFTNEFLINDYHAYYEVPGWLDLSFRKDTEGYPVLNQSGAFLFNVLESDGEEHVSGNTNKVMAMSIMVFILMLVFITFYISSISKSNTWLVWVLSYVAFMLLIRYMMIRHHVPVGIYNTTLFDPQLYAASFWLHSLGDLLLNVFIVISWVILIIPKLMSWLLERSKKNKAFGGVGLYFLITFFIWTAVESVGQITKGLILHSRISFDINNFFSLDGYSLIGLCTLGLSFGLVYWLVHRVFYSLKELKIPFSARLIGFLSGGALFTIWHVMKTVLAFGHGMDWFSAGWAMFLLILFIFMLPSRLSFLHTIGLILFFSIFSGYQIIRSIDDKEIKSRKTLVTDLAVESDPIAEFMLPEIRERLINDRFIQNYFANPLTPKHTFLERIRRLYFAGYFGKYDIDIRLFSESIPVWGTTQAFPHNTYKTSMQDSLSRHRIIGVGFEHFAATQNPHSGYLLEIPISFKGTMIGRLVIQLTQKVLHKPKFYPDLLLDRSIEQGTAYNEYDYAIYVENKLISTKGNYPYSLTAPRTDGKKEYFQFKEQDFEHLVFAGPGTKLVILSRVSENKMLIFITIVSYLFFFVLLLVLMFIVFTQIYQALMRGVQSKPPKRLFPLLFRTRTQMAMIALILLSFIMVGWRTYINFKSESNQYHQDRLLRKVRAVSSAIQFEVEERGAPFIQTEEVHQFVNKLSTIHAIDVNLYSLNGDLLSTSQLDIVDRGLTSKKIQPKALSMIVNRMNTKFVHNEQIGSFNYLTAYVPVTIGQGNIIAILNLPYYAKEKDLQNEIEGLMVNLINVYGLLFVIGSFLAIFLAYPVTSSITMIVDKLNKIKLGKKNEPIEWQTDDEIGSLVKEYNKMIKALEESAALLAKSERESAWREMARQVAHEIKNPLTPMKLSIQHLQRASQKDDPNLKELMNQVSSTLIEQIDNLSYIASEFSNFANMPRANNEHFNINQVLESVTDLYKKNENLDLEVIIPENKEYQVYADKNQISRVFTNLILNAVQSIPEEKRGEVKVHIEDKTKHVIIKISDNGGGISDDIKQKVFEPNFTTKSSGTGLGLAMTRSIIEQANGSIWFESVKDVGTTFYVQIPLSNGNV